MKALPLASATEGMPPWDVREVTLIVITPVGEHRSANVAGRKRVLLAALGPGDVVLATGAVWPEGGGKARRIGPVLVDDVAAVRAALGMPVVGEG